jgi:hypothetical protein
MRDYVNINSFSNANIKDSINNVVDYAHCVGIVLTGWLPLSTRSLLVKIITAPFIISLRILQSSESDFCKKLSDYMVEDWNGGISDSYIDLDSAFNQELQDQVVKENFRYAAYMKSWDNDSHVEDYRVKPKFVYLLNDENFPYEIEDEALSTLTEIRKNLFKIGFEYEKDNLFKLNHAKTNINFHIAYDVERKEVILCFRGIKSFFSYAMLESLQDWFGGHPSASLQAIEIGKILKEATAGTSIKPVTIGHSNGGGFAQAAAAANGLKSIVFNSRPMGSGMRRYIGQNKIAENAKNMVVFSTKGDWLTGNRVVNLIAILFERIIGIVVPRNIGKGYQLANYCKYDTHDNYYFDLMPKNNFFPGKIYSLLESLRERGLFKASWNNSQERFFFGQSLFQLNLHSLAIEVEANHFTNNISISAYLNFFSGDLNNLTLLKKKFPHLHFEYRHYPSKEVDLRCFQTYDNNRISSENDLKLALESLSKETLEVQEHVSNFAGECQTWGDYNRLHYMRSLHGFGVKSI